MSDDMATQERQEWRAMIDGKGLLILVLGLLSGLAYGWLNPDPVEPQEAGYSVADELCSPDVELAAKENVTRAARAARVQGRPVPAPTPAPHFRWLDGDRFAESYQEMGSDPSSYVTYIGYNIEMIDWVDGKWKKHYYLCYLDLDTMTMRNEPFVYRIPPSVLPQMREPSFVWVDPHARRAHRRRE